MNKKLNLFLIFASAVILFFAAFKQEPREIVDPHAKIPPGNQKQGPESDLYPPILHSDEFEQPIPLPFPINSAGGEDSAFIPCCGLNEFYFFFTPDVQAPLEDQLQDGVTGIYFSSVADGAWQEPTRVWLQDPGKLSLDGCAFTLDNTIWFCTAREGLSGLHWFRANVDRDDGLHWQNWRQSDFPETYQVGELHISKERTRLFFHSSRPGGSGGLDLWTARWTGEDWAEPENLEILNSAGDEGWPALSQDEGELWFTRTYQGAPALFRSRRIDGDWGEPELIISQFAGEPTLDAEGNVYFTHHYYENGEMIEADIYVALRK